MLVALPIPSSPVASAAPTPSRTAAPETPGTRTDPIPISGAEPPRPVLPARRVTEPDRMSAASLLGSVEPGPDTLAGPPPTFDVSILERDRALASAPPELPPELPEAEPRPDDPLAPATQPPVPPSGRNAPETLPDIPRSAASAPPPRPEIPPETAETRPKPQIGPFSDA